MKNSPEKNKFENKPFTKKDNEAEKDLKNEISPETELSKELQNQKAIEIAQKTGDYTEIVCQLKDEGLWEKERKEVEKKYSSIVNISDFPTKISAVWDMLTVLDLYDSQTAEHCADTYRLAKERIERVMTKHSVLAEVLRNENVEMEQFHFASLTHDIGKVCIPPFVVSNSLEKRNWDNLFLEMAKEGELSTDLKTKLGIENHVEYTHEELLEKLTESETRSKDIVPIKKGLSDYELFCLEEQWHLSGDKSLMEILDQHAQFSEEILVEQGYEATGKLVGQHHHKNNHGIYLPTFKDLPNNSDLADILHLADAEQALQSKRHYKEAFSELDTILSLKEEAERGGVGKAITFFWLRDKRSDFLKNTDLSDLTYMERRSLQELNMYLESFLEDDSLEELEKWTRLHLRN